MCLRVVLLLSQAHLRPNEAVNRASDSVQSYRSEPCEHSRRSEERSSTLRKPAPVLSLLFSDDFSGLC